MKKHTKITLAVVCIVLLIVIAAVLTLSFKGNNQSEAVYEPVKQDYRDQMTELFNEFESTAIDWNKLQEDIHFNYEYFQAMYNGIEDIYDNDKFGFAYRDIDNNGTDEMIVFINGLAAIWTNDGEKAVCLIESSNEDNSTIRIQEDGKIFESRQYGNGMTMGVNGDVYLYEIDAEEAGLKVVEHYVMVARDNVTGIEINYEKEDGSPVDESIINKYLYGDDYDPYDHDYTYDEFEGYEIEPLFQQ